MKTRMHSSLDFVLGRKEAEKESQDRCDKNQRIKIVHEIRRKKDHFEVSEVVMCVSVIFDTLCLEKFSSVYFVALLFVSCLFGQLIAIVV